MTPAEQAAHSAASVERWRMELRALEMLAALPGWTDPSYGLARVLKDKATEAEAARDDVTRTPAQREEWLHAKLITRELHAWLPAEIAKRQAWIAHEEAGAKPA